MELLCGGSATNGATPSRIADMGEARGYHIRIFELFRNSVQKLNIGPRRCLSLTVLFLIFIIHNTFRKVELLGNLV